MDLLSLGWNEQYKDLFLSYAGRGLVPARVLRIDRGSLLLADEQGIKRAVVAGRLAEAAEDLPVVGDWVAVDTGTPTTIVQAILPRTGELARQRPGRATSRQIAAANVDIVLVVEGLDRGPNRGRLERGTALAWNGGATPLVVLTKTDLTTDLDAAVAAARAAAPFVEVLAISSVTGNGLAALRSHLPVGSTAVLLGPSGSGKTSLVNCLVAAAEAGPAAEAAGVKAPETATDQESLAAARPPLATGAVRRSDHRGRHTTTRRELVLLPDGGCLIDTPGVRELGLWLDSEAIDSTFADLGELAADCRFRDCQHQDEPGCAVRAAIREGRLDGRRLAAWHKLRREAQVLMARVDVAEQRRAKNRDRQLAKLIRQVGRLKSNR